MGAKSTPDLNSDLEYERDQSNLDRARSDAEDGSVDVIEISGTIKWFDVAKGFGFIVPDNGMADVLVHVTCLRRDGYKTAYEGARIVCEALDRPGGLQASVSFRWMKPLPNTLHKCQRREPMWWWSQHPSSNAWK